MVIILCGLDSGCQLKNIGIYLSFEFFAGKCEESKKRGDLPYFGEGFWAVNLLELLLGGFFFLC